MERTRSGAVYDALGGRLSQLPHVLISDSRETIASIARDVGCRSETVKRIRKLYRMGGVDFASGRILVDFVDSENSMGFHADQEAARLLTLSVDYSRRGQIALRDAPN